MPLAKTEFFLGSISQKGFQTHFDKEIKKPYNFTYILKGGAGTGKSSLMKKVAKEFENDDDISIFYCASDPNSLDAVYLKNKKVVIVDGTSPHVFDPQYPGVSQEIVNLGEYWDKEKLVLNSTPIHETTDENQRWHKRCRNFVSALSSLFSDTYSISRESLLCNKLEAFEERFSHKILPKKKMLSEGKSSFGPISALTPQGYKTLFSSIENYNDIYVLSDNYFSGSDIFLRDFATIATSLGYDIIISECSILSTKVYEHLLIPELSIALISSTPLNNIEIPNAKPINFLRFYDKEFIKHKKQRLGFNKKACADIVDEAVNALKIAKDVHDDIESYYISSMNFNGLDDVCNRLIEEIKSK